MKEPSHPGLCPTPQPVSFFVFPCFPYFPSPCFCPSPVRVLLSSPRIGQINNAPICSPSLPPDRSPQKMKVTVLASNTHWQLPCCSKMRGPISHRKKKEMTGIKRNHSLEKRIRGKDQELETTRQTKQARRDSLRRKMIYPGRRSIGRNENPAGGW